ncbi:LamG-like jellyroll fold domain-containing protein [Vibrio bivalvicida]|uniref:LamG-like jellyroll fold domain-containing protein n=1 Tax=Vibrio bivalvicida TaxID=1276888 RepID=A0ABV4ML53_9VIBR
MSELNILLKLCFLFIAMLCSSVNAYQVEYRYNLRGQLVSEKGAGENNSHNLDSLGNRLSVLYGSNGAHLSSPVLNEPANGAVFNFSQPILFSWEAVNGAVSYDLWFGKDLSNLKQFKTGIKESQIVVELNHIVDSKPRYWKVIARNGYGRSSASNVFTFSAIDSDNDQLPDHIEEQLCTSSQHSDSDGDGLADNQEIRFGESTITTSFPCLQDSDFDGIEDAYEVKVGSDPMVVDSYRSDSWSHYVDWIAEKHQQQQVEIVSTPRVLDVRNSDGYAISGIAPDGEALSLTYWIKHSHSDTKQTMGSDDDNGRRFYIGVDKENSVTFGVGNISTTLSKVKIEDERWTHFTMTYSGSTAKIYVNGQLRHTWRGLTFKDVSQYALWFGARHQKRAWQAESVEGVIDNLSVWRAALSAEEVAKSMFSLDSVTSSDLVAYYDFNHSRGEWVQNKVTNKFDLKLAAGAELSAEEDYLDTDSDGLADTFEQALCTNSDNPDSDGDGVSDGEEFGIESRIYTISNACQVDSDNDGIPDDYEYQLGMNPAVNDVLKLNSDTGETYWQGYISHSENVDSNLDVIVQDRHFDVTDSQAYAITGLTNNREDFTLMYWFKPKMLSEQYSGFSGSGRHKLALGIDRYRAIEGTYNTSSSLIYFYNSEPIVTNSWQHFALSWNFANNHAQVYLNGELAYSGRVPSWFSREEPLALWVGAQNVSSTPKHFMNGVIDDVQFWKRSLAQHQVRRYMTEPPQGQEQGLVSYYDFSKSRGAWVYNKTNDKFDLKLTDASRLKLAEPKQDSDCDGLSDAFESGLCLDPNHPDTDNDGLLDRQELVPANGLKSTNPCSIDTDNDGIDDKFEQENGFDPTLHDVNQVSPQRKITNWQFYATRSKEKLLAQGEEVESVSGELNVSGNLGYAVSGIAFDKYQQQATLMYWFKTDKSDLAQYSGVKKDTYKGHYLGIDKLNKPFSRSWGQVLETSATVKSDVWTHIALVISDNTKKLYVNGQLEQVISIKDYLSSDADSTYAMWFGAVNYLGKDVFHQSGQIDDIQLWSKPLSQQDIINYMRKRPEKRDKSLVAWYDFSQYLGGWVKNAATDTYDLKLVKGAHIVESEQSSDSDRDGLSDEFETTYCTEPEKSDSDGDGLNDGQEINVGVIINGQKVTTDPCTADTDNDGIDDAFEIINSMNPALADGHIVDAQGQQTHWQRYIEELNQSDEFQSASEQNEPGVLDIEGSEGYAITGYYPTSDPATIMFWYKPNEELFVYDQSVSGVIDVSNRSSLALGHSMLGAMYRIDSYSWIAYDHDLVNEQWNHFALTIGDKHTTLYINGQQALLRESITKSIAYPFFLGAANIEGLAGGHMNGKLDNVIKWKRELTREEVRRFMITPPNPESDSTLEWLYRFDHTKNGWVNNEVTNLYDLKLVHGAKISAERPVVDLDKDGLDDKLEIASCLDATRPDTDGDGLLDGQEYGVNSNYSTITDPCLSDTDRDNIPDSFELDNSSNPLIADAGHTANATGKRNNWQVYANSQVSKLPQTSQMDAKRALQLSDNSGYAISNHFFDSHDMTLMFWGQYQANGQQQLGNMDTHKLGFSRGDVVFGDKYSSRSKLGNLSADGWVHLALVLSNSGKTQLYVNGVKVDEKHPHRAELSNVWATYIGAVNDNGIAKEYMEGLVDNVGIWNRAISPSEIYQYMFTAPAPSDEGLAAWYDFTHSKGDWIMNLATGEYDLKLTHGAHLVAEPSDEDSDGDGLVDRLELAFCTDGLTADSDGDGISDGDELSVGKPFILITNPCDPDSDHDGLTDDFERAHGSDGLIADANFDSNGNGISNWDEYRKTQTKHLPETSVESGTLSLSKGYAITPFFPKSSNSTFMYWFKSDSLESQLSGVSENSEQHYYAGVEYAQRKFAWGEDRKSGYSFNEPEYSVDEWNHLALVISDNQIKLFINGVLITKSPRAWSSIAAPFNHALWLGSLNKQGQGSDYFNGFIDNVQIWDKALSDNEIKTHMALTPDKGAEDLHAMYDFTSIKGNWVKNIAKDEYDLLLLGDIHIESLQLQDSDGDSIPDFIEHHMCTDHQNSDTDGDGSSDAEELKEATSPCSQESNESE